MAETVECCGTRFWLYLLICMSLVLFAGLMSGLTLGLMSLGLVDLEVLTKSGRPQDKKHAAKILPVVRKQHLLLCTLLIGNSLAMEALPIFLDSLINPWGAILISVTLILMFGEILPQAVCSRYGLAVGAAMAPVVRVLLLVFFPVAYPISKLLDWLLGKGHMVLLRRAELKTLVDMHGNEAGKGGELTHDETTIIGGALELTEKTAVDAMTPISKAFALNLDAKLDMQTMNLIMTKGHSRVPVYHGNPANIIGLILVKGLLMLRPEDNTCIRDLTIRKIPRVQDNMPLYDILNEFQKGQSHIAVVVKYSKEKLDLLNQIKQTKTSKYRQRRHVDNKRLADESDEMRSEGLAGNLLHGSETSSQTTQSGKDGDGKSGDQSSATARSKKRDRTGTKDIIDLRQGSLPSFPDEEVVGIITMEDVIEELLQEEILDETDEYIDVHNKIKVNMLAPGRKSPLLPPVIKFRSPEASPMSSLQMASPSVSPLSSIHHTPVIHSPASPHSQMPALKPRLSLSPSRSLPGSPLFPFGSRLQVVQKDDSLTHIPNVAYEKLKKDGE